MNPLRMLGNRIVYGRWDCPNCDDLNYCEECCRHLSGVHRAAIVGGAIAGGLVGHLSGDPVTGTLAGCALALEALYSPEEDELG